MNLLQNLVQHAQAVVAQVNPLDNGRTYNSVMQHGAQYAPQAPSSVVQQATHNGVTNAAGQVAQNFTNVPMAAVNMGRGMFDQFATDNQTAAQHAYGQALNQAHNNVITGLGHQLAGFGQAG
ncbi:MAG TPA: hypothetical protein VH234_04575, partial [Candidatus Saccharimonadales bacterium]|nr:hypothetical protein [Candidatus Saccharimonadales bacterium]